MILKFMPKKTKYKLTILLLAHNEEKTISQEIKKISSTLNKINHDILVVEDGSSDNTVYKLKQMQNKITFYTSKKRIGYSNALLKGIKNCNSTYIMHSDTGNKFDYNEIKKFYKIIIKENLDLVAAHRIKRFDNKFRQILTSGLGYYCNFLFNIRFNDYDCGFKMYKTKTLKEILKSKPISKNLISCEIFLRFVLKGKKIKQIKVKYFASKYRKSRGLPFLKITKVIFEAISNLHKIKKKFI